MSDTKVTPADLQRAIRNIPDFPQPGIQFKDITPVLADARLLAGCVDLLTGHHSAGSVDAAVGIDACGFNFAVAAKLTGMSWLHSLDVGLFRFINLTLSNPILDGLMPFFSGNSLFVPVLMALAAVVAWRAGPRGRVCAVMVVLVICLGDP